MLLNTSSNDQNGTPWFGFVGYFSKPIAQDLKLVERLFCLLADKRWPWLPRLAEYAVSDGGKKSKKIPIAKRTQLALVEAFVDESFYRLSIDLSRDDKKNISSVAIDTGSNASSYALPFSCEFQTRGYGMKKGKDVQGWIDLMHDFVKALQITHAVLPVFGNQDACTSDITGIKISLDGVPAHPRPNERLLDSVWRDNLGVGHLRHPRWGTYLNKNHIEKLGGVALIQKKIDPFLVKDFGGLTFFQLTSIEDCLSLNAEEKRLAFSELAKPLLPSIKWFD